MTTQQDRELRDWLRSIDPASDLGPLRPEDRVALLHRVRGLPATAAVDSGGPPREALAEAPSATEKETVVAGPGARRTVSWVVGAAAALVLAVVWFALVRDHEPAAAPPVAEPAASSTTVSATGAGDTRCPRPTPELLARVDVAVDATVRAVEGDLVRLVVQRWYVGTPTEELVVTAPPDSLQALLGAPDLEIGQRYLLAADDGQLMVCGFSGPLDPDRSTLYTAAFGG